MGKAGLASSRFLVGISQVWGVEKELGVEVPSWVGRFHFSCYCVQAATTVESPATSLSRKVARVAASVLKGLALATRPVVSSGIRRG